MILLHFLMCLSNVNEGKWDILVAQIRNVSFWGSFWKQDNISQEVYPDIINLSNLLNNAIVGFWKLAQNSDLLTWKFLLHLPPSLVDQRSESWNIDLLSYTVDTSTGLSSLHSIKWPQLLIKLHNMQLNLKFIKTLIAVMSPLMALWFVLCILFQCKQKEHIMKSQWINNKQYFCFCL